MLPLFWVFLCCIVVSSNPTISKEHFDPVRQHVDKSGHHLDEYDHQAVLGSKEEEDEYGQMAPVEAKEKLGKLVDKMDEDKDGFITVDELQVWVEKSFRSLDEEEAIEHLSEQDKNNDGNISWQEFVSKVYGYEPEEITEFEKQPDREMQEFLSMIHADKKKFQAADRNKDNVLDKSEYAAFLHPYDHPQMADYEVQRTLMEHDANSDGVLDFTEYIKNEKLDAEMLALETEQFESHDANKDGHLDMSEIREWILPDHQEAAKEEAEHLVQETDSNKDGRLSKDEIIENHELWVGSQATDYGQQLRDEL